MRRRTPRSRILPFAFLILATAGLLVGLPAQPSWASMSLDKTWDLGHGITLERWSGAGPIHAFVLKFKPNTSPATLDVAMPTSELPGDAVTSAIGASHHAAAAVNGDFGHGRPLHATAVDGVLWQTGPQHGSNFSLAANEDRAFIGNGHPHVTASGPTGSFAVARWNSGPPTDSEIAGYSPKGGSLENAPGKACSVRLKKAGNRNWTSGRRAVGQRYVVDASRCRRKAMAERGMTVLSIKDSAARRDKRDLKRLDPGDRVSIRWTMGWPDVLDTIGGRPVIVQHGNNVAPTTCQSYLCGKNPRTGVGFDSHGNVMIAVIDGRIPSWSIGMYLNQFGGFFAHELHATAAMNLDGGGSATMWVRKTGPWCSGKPTGVTKGCIVNYANVETGYKQRPVEDALLVLPGPDPGE
jgi:hypothetical protein